MDSALFLFLGKDSPSKSTSQKRMPCFSHGHWASEVISLLSVELVYGPTFYPSLLGLWPSSVEHDSPPD